VSRPDPKDCLLARLCAEGGLHPPEAVEEAIAGLRLCREQGIFALGYVEADARFETLRATPAYASLRAAFEGGR
jgi:hypothetical protein